MYRFRRQGRGETLVLQHGFLCGPGYWQETQERLSDCFDVVVPTLPGFADHAMEPALDSIPDYAEYLIGALDQLGVERFHLLGHSMGGMIAQEVALKFSERVDRLILFGTGPIGEMPGRFETLEESRKRVEDTGPGPMIENTVATWFMQGRQDPAYAGIVNTARQASLPAILGGYRAMEDWRSLERLDAIRIPTLILWGDGDRSYRRDQADLLHRGIQGSVLKVMPGCSHNAHLENPRSFQEDVRAFLSNRD